MSVNVATRRNAGWRHLDRAGAFVAAIIIAIIVGIAGDAGAEAAVRDPVPLPRPNPLVTASAAQQATQQPTGLGRLFGKKPADPSPASRPPPTRQSALANISAYFNSFRTMEGEFIQIGPRGEQSEGVFFLSKPGKIRFHYKPPVQLDVISDGRSVAIRDNKARTQDLYPLSKTPLRYLLDDKIDLTSSKTVDEVVEEADLISLIIVEKSALVKGKLTLIFDRQSYELRQWIVTDAQGLNTSVAIFNTATGKPADLGLFRISVSPAGRD